MTYTSIAYRSLKYEPKRYALLFIAASIGIAIAITAISLMNGMLNSFNNKARIYYGGDLILLHSNNGSLGWYNTDEVISQIEPYFNSKEFFLSSRIDFENDSTYLFFEGQSYKQRKLKGVDFNTACKQLLVTLDFCKQNLGSYNYFCRVVAKELPSKNNYPTSYRQLLAKLPKNNKCFYAKSNVLEEEV